MTDDMALTLYEPQNALDMVRPLVAPGAARQAIQQYEALKSAIVQDSDKQTIQGRTFLKKSFWRRVATCFGLSLDLVSEQRGFDEGGKLFYSVVYRAVAPNGRSMIGDGYCSTGEQGRGGWPEHNVRATAHTRAKNRAISDLVGGGEVSADEMPDYVDEAPPAARQAPRPAVKAPPKPDTWAAVRARASSLGITVDVFERACERYAGSTDPARMTAEGKRALVAYLDRAEAAKGASANINAAIEADLEATPEAMAEAAGNLPGVA